MVPQSLIPRIYRALNYKEYYCFSYFALDLIFSNHYKKWNFNPFNYYEFGTGEGTSLKFFLRSLKKVAKNKKIDLRKFNIFLFDSFEGLPNYNRTNDFNPAWNKGLFKGSLNSIKSVIKNNLPEILPNVKFVKGFYENTLTQKLRASIIKYPPSIVNIDVDYYSSAKTVLEWIYPLCQEGSIFYFDDIFEYLGNLSKGEFRAINEFNKSHLHKGFQFYPFTNFGIASFTGKIFTLNHVDKNSI